MKTKPQSQSPRKAPPTKPLRVTWSGLNALVVMSYRGALTLDRSVSSALLRNGLVQPESHNAFGPTLLGRDLLDGQIPVRVVGTVPSRWCRQEAADIVKRWSEMGIMIISRTGGKR